MNLKDKLESKAVTFSTVSHTPLSQKLASNVKTRTPISVQEIARICALPIKDTLNLEEVTRFNRRHINAIALREGFEFFDVQLQSVLEYEQYQGLFAPIGVGWGKTLITLMIATAAYETGTDKILLLVPPNVYSQLLRRDIPWARSKVSITVPFHGMGKKSLHQRMAIAHSGRRGCYILPYSCLQTRDARSLLEGIQPELILADEVHYLKNRKAARTKRLMSYIDKHSPKGVCLSGTITSKSIRDYHHLLRWCLGNRSPLPQSVVTTGEWSCVLDADAEPSASQTAELRPLLEWALRNFPKDEIAYNVTGFRKAYKRRLTSCPGVVATGDHEIGVSLTLTNIKATQEMNDHTKDLIKAVEDDYITPNGDPIDHAIHTYKWLYELNSGIWHKLAWPSVETLSKRRSLSSDEAESLIGAARKHHQEHNEYLRLLRSWLNNSNKPGIDTPMLVGQDMHQHKAKHVGYELYSSWQYARSLEVDNMPERDSSPIRVDDFKVNALMEWVKKQKELKGILIWVYHKELGKWAVERLKTDGYDVLHCPSGTEYDRIITDPESANRIVVASMSAHGLGKNLQHFQHPYYLQWPRPADMAEQTLGRVHRQGQMADEIIATTCLTTAWDELNFAATLNDALYIHQSIGARQKCIFANYDPLPVVKPSGFLRERGFQNTMLNKDDQKVLTQKFKS